MAEPSVPRPAPAAAVYDPFPGISAWVSRPFKAPGFDSALSELRSQCCGAPEVLAAAGRLVGATAAVGVSVPEGSDELAMGSDGGTLELLVGVATGQRPIDELTILALHGQACAGQDSFLVRGTAPGGAACWRARPLPKGVYKTSPNRPGARRRVYATVAQTASEVKRLIAELRSPAFYSAHPAAQAAYAHHALVCVHPFADGNGRVARALAAICLERATGLPVLLDLGVEPVADPDDGARRASKRREGVRRYLDALVAADDGRYEVFSRFVADRAEEAMRHLIPHLGRAPAT